MTLIGRLIGKLLKRGSITLITPDGKRATYGPGGGKALTIRLRDRRVAFDLIRNPRLGVGEAYMDGRLIIEDGTILDLLELVTGSNRWEDGGKGAQADQQGQARRAQGHVPPQSGRQGEAQRRPSLRSRQ